jgi:tetratricopeptide (TPR) repeat protein
MAGIMSRGLWIVRCVLLLLVVAAMTLALDRWVVLPLHCSHAASVGAADLDNASDTADYRPEALARRINANLEGCNCVSPPDARICFVRGAVAQGGGDLVTAIADYRRALEIDRRPEIYLHLGLAQLQTTDRSTGLESLVRACAFDPSRLGAIDESLQREVKRTIRARYGQGWMR